MIVDFLRRKRRALYFWGGVFCCVVAVLVLVLAVSKQVIRDQRQVPAYVGGYCAVLATALSLLQLLEHLSCFGDPECQTKIVRILFMVPVYAVISWLSILYPTSAEYLNLIRDAYEAYAIYAFFSLMLALMGGADVIYRHLMTEEHPSVPQLWPLCYMDPLPITPRFVQNCRLCIFQFMVCKPLITLVVIALTATNSMGNDIFDPSKGYLWTALVYNISITIAFYALAYFYVGLREPFMVGKNALSKFLCVKAVIFASYWQGIVIAIIAALGVLPKFDYWRDDEAARGLQDFLICIEMMLISFAHKFCFPSGEFAVEDDDADGTSGVVVVSGAAIGTDGNATAAGGSNEAVTIGSAPQPPVRRVVPPARRSIWSNIVFTLRHEDLMSDVRNIIRRS